MRLCDKHLRELIRYRLIQEKKLKKKVVSSPYSGAADVIKNLAQAWGIKDENSPEGQKIISALWKQANVKPSESDIKSKDYVGKKWPWSAATISTAFAGDSDFRGAAAHRAYMKGSKENRKAWIKQGMKNADQLSSRGYKGYVAFKRGEYAPKTGDLICNPRGKSGNPWSSVGDENHCDICVDDACTQVGGGNTTNSAGKADMLAVKKRGPITRSTMIITKNPKVVEPKKALGEAIRLMIREELLAGG